MYREKGIECNFHSGFLDLNKKCINIRRQKGKEQSKFAMNFIKDNLMKKIEDMKGELLIKDIQENNKEV